MRFHLADGLTAIIDLTALQFEQTGDRMHRRGLAGAVGADQRNNFTLVHMEGNIPDGMDGTVEDIDILDGKHLPHRQSPPRYAAITFGLLRMALPSPRAITRP